MQKGCAQGGNSEVYIWPIGRQLLSAARAVASAEAESFIEPESKDPIWRVSTTPPGTPNLLRSIAAGACRAEDKAALTLEFTRERIEIFRIPIADDVETIRVVQQTPGMQWVSFREVGTEKA